MFQPSPYQEAIFQELANGTGHLVVIARAGSGKTTTLIEGLNYLPPCRRLLCAFNTEIKDELEIRAGARAKVMTLHGLGMATLKKNPLYRNAELDKEKGYRLAREAVRRRGLKFATPEGESEFVGDVVKAASLAKVTLTATRNGLINLVEENAFDTAEHPSDEFAAIVADAVRAAVDDKQYIDFDDMIWLPNIYNLHPPLYEQVIIDEAQDMSLSQLRLAMRACCGRIIAVGDPRQAIYGWRGADEGAIERVVTELGAKTLPLSVSYRCPKKVVEMAREYVPDIEAAPDAGLGVVDEISCDAMLHEVKQGDYILSRSNAPLVDICTALNTDRKPARIVGRDAGQTLVRLVRASRAENVNQLVAFLERYEEEEENRLKERPEAFGKVIDKIESLRSIAQHEPGIREIYASIDRFFSDKTGTSIACSTVHKAKGKERARVFLLRETFFRYDGPEEENIFYVGITRAKEELHLVTGLYSS